MPPKKIMTPHLCPSDVLGMGSLLKLAVLWSGRTDVPANSLAGIRLFTQPSTVLGDNGDLVFHSVPPGHCFEGRRKWTDWSGRIELSMWTHRLGSKSKLHLVEIKVCIYLFVSLY